MPGGCVAKSTDEKGSSKLHTPGRQKKTHGAAQQPHSHAFLSLTFTAVLHALFFGSIIARPFLLCNCYFPHRSPDRSACTAGVGRSCVSCRPDDGAAGRLERRSRPAPPAVSMIFSPSCAASPLSGQLPISKLYPVQGAAVGLDTDPPRDLNPTGGMPLRISQGCSESAWLSQRRQLLIQQQG